MILCDGSFSSTASDCMYSLQRAIPRSGGGGQGHLWLPWTRQKNMEWISFINDHSKLLWHLCQICTGGYSKADQRDQHC